MKVTELLGHLMHLRDAGHGNTDVRVYDEDSGLLLAIDDHDLHHTGPFTVSLMGDWVDLSVRQEEH